MSGLVEAFQGIVDGYYAGSDPYKRVVDALTQYDRIVDICQIDSLASDGMLMIEAALRDRNSGMDT